MHNNGYYIQWAQPGSNLDKETHSDLPNVESSVIASKVTPVITAISNSRNDRLIEQILPSEPIGSYGMSAQKPEKESLLSTNRLSNELQKDEKQPLVRAEKVNLQRESVSEPIDDETLIAALLCWFLGMFGAHWFYLGKNGKGKTRLLLTLISFASVYGGFFVTYLLSPYLGLLMIYGGYLFLLFLFAMNIIDLVKILQGKY
jgi:TM2 domain-containing membrane protein YozV